MKAILNRLFKNVASKEAVINECANARVAYVNELQLKINKGLKY